MSHSRRTAPSRENPSPKSGLRSPRSSSSVVTPNNSASAGITDRSGAASPRSQRETALSDTFSSSASSRWVRPFARRSAAMNEPIALLSTFSTPFTVQF